MIGDGAGLDYWSAAKLASRVPLSIEEFPVVGLVDTESVDSRITDSAAGATAYATGVRTYNGAISVDADSAALETVLEVARSEGWGTGLVATSAITHATPASFAAHVPNRGMYQEIARQMAQSRIDVLLGGGEQDFAAETRDDGEDLIARLKQRAVYVEHPDTFLALDMDTVPALVGLFTAGQPGPATDRRPNLAELTDGALDLLEEDPDGFFLMVEGSQIDWLGHDNAPLRQVIAEVQDFDMAILRALRFQDRRPNTLIIVTADHSTGGLALHPDDEGVMEAHYTTTGHTAGLVPLFARGPEAEAFGGVLDNDRVGRLLLQLVREGGAGTAP
jgi:alkaline phosphatase